MLKPWLGLRDFLDGEGERRQHMARILPLENVEGCLILCSGDAIDDAQSVNVSYPAKFRSYRRSVSG